MSAQNGKKPRHFTADEKPAIFEEAWQTGTTVAGLLRRNQLEATTFCGCERAAKAGIRKAFGGMPTPRDADLRDHEREIAWLKAELGQKRQVIAGVVEENLALKGALKVRESTRFSAVGKADLLTLVAHRGGHGVDGAAHPAPARALEGAVAGVEETRDPGRARRSVDRAGPRRDLAHGEGGGPGLTRWRTRRTATGASRTR